MAAPPNMVLCERLKAKSELAKPVTKPPHLDALPKALQVAAEAKEVSHPSNPQTTKTARQQTINASEIYVPQRALDQLHVYCPGAMQSLNIRSEKWRREEPGKAMALQAA